MQHTVRRASRLHRDDPRRTSRVQASNRPTRRTRSSSPQSLRGRGTSFARMGRYFEGRRPVRRREAGRHLSSAPNSARSPVRIWSRPPARLADADFDVLIACAFNYEAHASEFNKLGRIPVLKARMNADLHMADDLKNTGQGESVRHLRRAGHRHPFGLRGRRVG